MVRDVGLAEEFAHDALVTALAQWPEKGVPANPAAWLMAAGKRRAIDHLRRAKMLDRKHGEIGYDMEIEQQHGGPDVDAALDDDIGDDLLSLIFTACHPLLSPEARIALTLKLVGGLTTEEIARAFLVPEPTVAQRIVRAKRTLSEAGMPFEVPHGADRADRLTSVLDVLYLIFNEGYSATSGDDWIRPQLCEEAMRLGRILAGLAPSEPEVHGLVALMEIQASRLRARTGADGAPVLLADQDRPALGSPAQSTRGSRRAAAFRATELADRGADPAPCRPRSPPATRGPGRRPTSQTGRRIAAALSEQLARLTGSACGRGQSRGRAGLWRCGPEAGLDVAGPAWSTCAALRESYHLLPGVRGDLLARLGRPG